MPELIIKSVEGLNLVSDKELFISTVNGTENVGFAKWLTAVCPIHGQVALKEVCRISPGHIHIFHKFH